MIWSISLLSASLSALATSDFSMSAFSSRAQLVQRLDRPLDSFFASSSSSSGICFSWTSLTVTVNSASSPASSASGIVLGVGQREGLFLAVAHADELLVEAGDVVRADLDHRRAGFGGFGPDVHQGRQGRRRPGRPSGRAARRSG